MFLQFILIAVLIFAGLFFTVGTIASVIDKWNETGASIINEIGAMILAALLFTFALILIADTIVNKLGPVG